MAAVRYTKYDVTPTISTTAYSAGDVVGGLMTIPLASIYASGKILKAMVLDDGDIKTDLTLYLYDAAPTTIANDAAFAPLHADNQKLIGTVAIAGADYTTVNSNAYVIKSTAIEYVGRAFYCYAVCTGTPTYAAANHLTFRFIVEEAV